MDSKDVKKLLFDAGADLCGIASIDRFTEAPEGYHPTDALPECKSVIVFAKRFLAASLQCKTQIPYTIVRNMLSDHLDQMAVQICLELEKRNYAAVPTGTIGPAEIDEKTGRQRSIVSAKHCAELAGLGRIGKNTLLITPEYGNMVWLSVILTNMVLEPDPIYEKELCGKDCSLCIDICPVNALDSLEMNQGACWDYAFGEKKGAWQLRCNRCRTICPKCLGTENRTKNNTLNL